MYWPYSLKIGLVPYAIIRQYKGCIFGAVSVFLTALILYNEPVVQMESGVSAL